MDQFTVNNLKNFIVKLAEIIGSDCSEKIQPSHIKGLLKSF